MPEMKSFSFCLFAFVPVEIGYTVGLFLSFIVNDFILFNESCLTWKRDGIGARSEDKYLVSEEQSFLLNVGKFFPEFVVP